MPNVGEYKEEAIMAKANEALLKHEQQKQEKKQAVPVLEGPIQMGRPIQMEEPITPMVTILEEERRVTLEGYVFDIEVRDLRSDVRFSS